MADISIDCSATGSTIPTQTPFAPSHTEPREMVSASVRRASGPRESPSPSNDRQSPGVPRCSHQP